MKQLHGLLKRQIKRHLRTNEALPDSWQPLLRAISDAYGEFDSDRLLLERALEISSKELFQANSEMRGVLQALPDTLFRINAGGEIVDLRQAESGQLHLPIYDRADQSERGAERLFWDAVQLVRDTRETAAFEYSETRNGRTSHYEARLLPFLDTDIIGIIRDITAQRQAEGERLQAEERMRWQAYHDALTELPNRSYFQERLDQALSIAEQKGQQLAVLFLDLDRFKNVNDSLGHRVGDVLLQQAAERLRCCVRGEDILARMGGDEFTVLIPRLTGRDEVASIARRLLDALEAPFILAGHELFIGGSIGISFYPEDGGTGQTLLQYADAAMYRIKGHGGNNFSFYTRSADVKARERLLLESDMRRALERREFTLLYQPQVDIANNWIVGVEALVRWNHHSHGMLSPDKFISLAEETGLILRLGDWVLREACRQASVWERQGYPLHIGVNLFARQFEQAELPAIVAMILEESGLRPTLLDLELTESAIIRHPEPAIEVLHALRSLGVHISVDDFGTGYSSLSYLRKLPIDMLKIDRSFVAELTGCIHREMSPPNGTAAKVSTEEAIVRAVIEVAHALGLRTIAEGVETQQQKEILQRLGCDIMQGYLYSPPIPVEQLEPLLQQQFAHAGSKAA